MDPLYAQKIHHAMQLAMFRLTEEYVLLMLRCGCKEVTLHQM